MRVLVLSITGVLLDTEADSLTAPESDGLVGIMKHHAPMVAALEKGTLSCTKDGETKTFELSGGVLEVKDDIVTILTD
jgi:F-type H+-transporting ATPase subunit epsilon